MKGPLSIVSHDLAGLVDAVADWSVDLLRRAGDEMSSAQDLAAMRDVEGAAEWRDLKSDRRYPE